MTVNLFLRNLRSGVAAALSICVLLAPAASAWQSTATAPKVARALAPNERELGTRVKAETIREVTSRLASKEMEGRGTATPGGDRAARYLADRFANLGIKPLGDNGTYLQAIKFNSFETLPESTLKAGDTVLKFRDEFVVAPPFSSDSVDATGAMVFIGYGIMSSTLKRDDFAGLDVKGKVVVVLGGHPKNVDKTAWDKATGLEALIGGLVMRGVAGIILADLTVSGLSYDKIGEFLSRRRVELAESPATPAMPFKLPPIVLVSADGARKLLSAGGSNFAELKEKAESGEFVSRDLNKPVTLALRLKREDAIGSNVVGLLEGSDPKLKEEAVVFSAHYDAFGTASDGRIYFGAADDALGVGVVMSIAEAFAKSRPRPRRSIIFLAVTGEEHGLLGAQYWVKHPTWPIEKVAADIQFDGIGSETYGLVKRVIIYGAEHSELGSIAAAVVEATGNEVTADPFPEEGAFYRSDHYAFVLKGVPGIMMLGFPAGDMVQLRDRAKKWLVTDYHQTTDTVRPEWNWEGPRTLALVSAIVGLRAASADAMPAWVSTSPYNRPRGTNLPPPPQVKQ
ncbi:MAG TPA: M20/M25/M40 family metallo-hydrolase [Blastocatellia bacterium]|nr:M20/M25/M40 family metallo-hydrolase [Blastocatellia bacterium]